MTVEVPDDIRASARLECANATSTIIKKNGSHRVELHRAAQQVAPRRSLGLAIFGLSGVARVAIRMFFRSSQRVSLCHP